MKKPSELKDGEQDSSYGIGDLLGLGSQSVRKNYYPALQERIDELQKQLDSMQELVDGVEARRAEVAGTIEKRLLTIYERRRGPRSKRVSAMRKGSCGTCFRQLPPQQRSEVRRRRGCRCRS